MRRTGNLSPSKISLPHRETKRIQQTTVVPVVPAVTVVTVVLAVVLVTMVLAVVVVKVVQRRLQPQGSPVHACIRTALSGTNKSW